MKRFSLSALFLALSFFISSAVPAFANTGTSLPNFRHLALASVAVVLVLVGSLRKHF